MSYEASGVVEFIDNTIQISERFKKREIVLMMGTPQYPEYVKFEFHQDKCDLLDKFAPGQAATIGFNLGGRKWQNPQGEIKYFGCNKAFYIKHAVKNQDAEYQPPAKEYQPPSTPPPVSVPGVVDDDVPF